MLLLYIYYMYAHTRVYIYIYTHAFICFIRRLLCVVRSLRRNNHSAAMKFWQPSRRDTRSSSELTIGDIFTFW